MGFIKSTIKWLFTTPEGCTILGAAAFGGGYFIGSVIGERQIKRELKMYESGVKAGINLHRDGYNEEDISVIMQKEPGVFGKKYARVIKSTPKTIDKPEKPCDTCVSEGPCSDDPA